MQTTAPAPAPAGLLALTAWLAGFAALAGCVEVIRRATSALRDHRSACWCGHPKSAHQHYRPGDDCGTCGFSRCPGYAPPRP
jgi:hypothetical protein